MVDYAGKRVAVKIFSGSFASAVEDSANDFLGQIVPPKYELLDVQSGVGGGTEMGSFGSNSTPVPTNMITVVYALLETDED